MPPTLATDTCIAVQLDLPATCGWTRATRVCCGPNGSLGTAPHGRSGGQPTAPAAEAGLGSREAPFAMRWSPWPRRTSGRPRPPGAPTRRVRSRQRWPDREEIGARGRGRCSTSAKSQGGFPAHLAQVSEGSPPIPRSPISCGGWGTTPAGPVGMSTHVVTLRRQVTTTVPPTSPIAKEHST